MKTFSILPPKAYVQALSDEINNLVKNTAITQKVITAINNREQCIANLYQMTSENINTAQEQVLKILEELRLISLAVVENVMKLKEQLNIHENLKIPILHKGKDYLAEMSNDIEFLRESAFGTWLNFSGKSDLFFLSLSRPVKYQFGAEPQKLLPITPVMLERIKKAENFLINEHLLAVTQKENAPTQKLAFNLQVQRLPMANYTNLN
eukprot:TRINITY_DN8888_c0_g4_i1.p1 TRINITY_DN8888_c0_g4~~TRINITY_DN8888_c0_g4_i1.p1  ORF type:complete len:208 (+),score=22.15 TRINITY_DN8888_c0_g4_i1:311-934(+)